MEFGLYTEILNTAQKYKEESKIEKNVFSIGGRGHYENPISDLLSFFIDPREEHNFKSLFLNSLLEIIQSKDFSGSSSSFIECKREVYTDEGNKIDLLVIGVDWVIVIENKIRHLPLNPFDDYYNYINNNYHTHLKAFLVLAPKKLSIPRNWRLIKYDTLIDSISDNLGNSLFNNPFHLNGKWIILLREFILNIKEQTGRAFMDKDKVEFISKNMNGINQMVQLRDEYLSFIARSCREILEELHEDSDIINQVHNWGVGFAVRSYDRANWSPRSNIALVVYHDGGFGIQIYVYDIPQHDTNIANQLKQLFDKYKYWVEPNNIQCFGIYDLGGLGNALLTFRNIANILDTFYSSTN